MNTGFLYGKMLITILISLYSTRLILRALGAEDYGIFNLVGGVIALLSFINSGMIVATGRYLSFYLGAGDENKLKSVFSSSVALHFIISLIIVVLLEAGGFFLFKGFLNIPLERISTAKLIFHFMIISTFFTINAVPYDASINAHENFLFDALVGIFESLAKLGIAIWLINTDFDKLILFGLLIAALTITIRIIKGVYCQRKYIECRIRIKSYIQIGLLKEMLAFAGWNLFSLFCYVLRTQGMAVVLNIFFGVLINAAYGIANQVNGALSSFSSNMIKAILPQIFKSGGSGNNERMLRLSVFACKISFSLLAFFAIPVIIEMPYVLNLWLKTVPENTIIFCQLILISSLVQQLTIGLTASITAVGKIKTFQLVTGAFQFLNLPLAFLLIKLGFAAKLVLTGSVFLDCIDGALVIWFAHKIARLDIKDFLINTVFKTNLSVIMAAVLALIVRFSMQESFLRVVLVTITSSSALLLFGKFIALTVDENLKFRELFMLVYNKIRLRTIVLINR